MPSWTLGQRIGGPCTKPLLRITKGQWRILVTNSLHLLLILFILSSSDKEEGIAVVIGDELRLVKDKENRPELEELDARQTSQKHQRVA